MRRGTVWIAGDVGDHLAHRMVAGTILVQGRVSSQWGTGMRRGSLLFAREPVRESGASLSPGRRLELSFLPLIWKHLHTLQLQIRGTEVISAKSLWPLLPLPSTRWVDRRVGDLAIGGKGEVLILQRQSSITTS
jgi:formylmethanofuran dehydrogenase subunit C